MRVVHVLMAIALICGVCRAQTAAPDGTPPASQGAPPEATARCNDGSYSKAKQKWQACGGHKGVQTWFAGGSTGPAKSTAAGPAPAAAQPPAAGDNAGKVWVNQQTKVYHCPGSKFFGKTKNGVYMTEAEAKKAGAHPDRGKPCGL